MAARKTLAEAAIGGAAGNKVAVVAGLFAEIKAARRKNAGGEPGQAEADKKAGADKKAEADKRAEAIGPAEVSGAREASRAVMGLGDGAVAEGSEPRVKGSSVVQRQAGRVGTEGVRGERSRAICVSRC